MIAAALGYAALTHLRKAHEPACIIYPFSMSGADTMYRKSRFLYMPDGSMTL